MSWSSLFSNAPLRMLLSYSSLRFLLLIPLYLQCAGQSSFGYFVHSFGSDLRSTHYLPRPEDRDMQAFVTVAFGDGQPIPQPFGVGAGYMSVMMGNKPASIPSFSFSRTGIRENDADGKQVVNAFTRNAASSSSAR